MSDAAYGGMRRFLSLGMVALAWVGTVAAKPSTLLYCSEGSPTTFNPALVTDGTTFDASSRAVFNRLIEFVPGTTQLQPGLAASWDIEDGGRRYVFHLRPHVPFHARGDFKPTRTFNADDVLFTFNRMRDKKHPYHHVSGGTYAYFDSMGFNELIRDIRKIDTHTVAFELAHPEAPFLADLAMDFASIHSAEYADFLLKRHTPEDLDRLPVGTGPFRMVRYVPDAMIRYEAFKDYWRKPPAIDRLVFLITPDAAVRWLKMRNHECHIMPYPNLAELETIRNTKGVRLLSAPGLNIGYLAFNVTKKPLDQPKVRLALALAMDQQAIIKAIYHDTAIPAAAAIPPSLWSHNKNLKPYPHDLQRARTLLAKAGHPDGFSLSLWAMPVQRPYIPDARRTAELIQADWAKIGVKAHIVSYEWGEYLKRAALGEHDAILMGWTGDNGDPDNFLGTLLSCSGVGTANNVARFCDPGYESLIRQGRQETDQAKRAAIYGKAQVMLYQLVPWVPIAYAQVFMPMLEEVHGYRISPLGYHAFEEVTLQP